MAIIIPFAPLVMLELHVSVSVYRRVVIDRPRMDSGASLFVTIHRPLSSTEGDSGSVHGDSGSGPASSQDDLKEVPTDSVQELLPVSHLHQAARLRLRVGLEWDWRI